MDVKMLFYVHVISYRYHTDTVESNFNLDYLHNLKPAGIIFWTSLKESR